MEHQVLEELLDNLAERFIPAGTHRLLHVDKRSAWKNLMSELIESSDRKVRVSFITKCAHHWELLLYQKISLLN